MRSAVTEYTLRAREKRRRLQTKMELSRKMIFLCTLEDAFGEYAT